MKLPLNSPRHPSSWTNISSIPPSFYFLLVARSPPCLRLDPSTDLGLQVSSKQLLRFAWCFLKSILLKERERSHRRLGWWVHLGVDLTWLLLSYITHVHEWIRPSVPSSIQPDEQFIHPIIRLFTVTLNPSIYSNPRSVLSSSLTVFFFGWVCFCGSSSGSTDTTQRQRFFEWVCCCGSNSGSADTTHRATLNPSRHPAGLFFFGWVCFCGSNSGSADTTHRVTLNPSRHPAGLFFFGWVCFCGNSSGSADTTHRATLNPSHHPAGLFFFGWVYFCGSNSGSADTTHKHRFFGWVCFCGSNNSSADTTHKHRFFGWVCFYGVWRTKCGGEFLTVDGVLLGERHACQ